MANTVSVILDLDTGKFTSDLKKAESQAEKSGNKVGDSFGGGFGKSLGSLGAIAAKAAGPLAALFAGGKIINSALEAEDSFNKLSNSLALIGENTSTTRNNLIAYADSVQATTRFSDDAILSALTLSQALGATANESKSVVTAATNLSTALGQDLETSVKELSETLNGTLPRGLAKVIPELKNLTAEQLRAGDAIDIVQGKFNGLAQKDANTLSGSLDKLANNFDNLLESIGGIVTSSPLIVGSINTISSGLSKLAGFIQETFNPNETQKIKALDETIASLNKRISEAKPAGLFNAYSPASIDFANLNNLKKQLSDLENQRKSLIDTQKKEDEAAQATSARLTDQAVKVTTFKSTLEGLKFTQGEIALATQNFNLALQGTDQSLLGTLQNVQALGLSLQELKIVLADPELTQNAIASTQEIDASFRGFADAVQFSASRIKVTNKTIADSFVNGLAGGVGNAFSRVGTALANGQNAFKAFGDAVIGSFGGVLGDLGQGFILQGTARLLAGDAGAGALIGAGAALKIFGAFLSAKSGGGGSSGGGGGSSAGGGVSIGPTNDTIPRQTVNTEPRTQVNLTIQGDVLDSDASALRIADLLNQGADGQGIIISRNARFA